MIKNKSFNKIKDVMNYYKGDKITLVVRFDNNIMDKLDYDDIIKHMENSYGLYESITKEDINQVLLRVIRGQYIDYDNTTNFGIVSKLFEHNIVQHFNSKWSSVKFVGRNNLKKNAEIQYKLEGVEFKMLDDITVKVEKLSTEDDFWG